MHGQEDIKTLCLSQVEIVNYLSNDSLYSKTNTKSFSSFRVTIVCRRDEQTGTITYKLSFLQQVSVMAQY